MRFLPVSLTEVQVMPETETEVMFLNNFLFQWKQGCAKITLKSGLMGFNSQAVLELRPDTPMIPSPFVSKAKK